jgi:hypothetical protein
VPFPYSKFVDRPIASTPDRINARSHQRPIASTPDRINARSHQGAIASRRDRIKARSLNLRFHPRSKCFHGDVSAGGFALL